jgi:acyl_carrier: acyl carrier protein
VCDLQRTEDQREDQRAHSERRKAKRRNNILKIKWNNRKEIKLWNYEKLQEIIVDVLNVNPDEITMDTTFVDDLGADSLDIFQIIMGIEEAFDIEIANEDAESIVTVGDAVEQIKNATN